MRVHPLLKRVAVTAFDGVIQALAVGFIGLVGTTAWLYLGRVHGCWRDRAIGAAVAFGAMVVFTSGFLLCQRFLRTHLNRRDKVKGYESSYAEKGYLDYRLDAEGGLSEANKALGRMTKFQDGISVALAKRTRQFESASRNGRNTKNFHRISSQTAAELEQYSERMDIERQALDRHLNQVSQGLVGVLAFQPPGAADIADLNALREGIQSMFVNNKSARESQEKYCDSVSAIRGISQALNRAADRHQQVIREVIKTLGTNEVALKEILQTIDVRLATSSGHE